MSRSSSVRTRGGWAWVALAACGVASGLAPAPARADAAAPGVDCQLHPVRGSVCGLYHDISGSASAGGSRAFASGPAYTLGSQFAYQGRVDAGAAFTYASAQAVGFATFGLLRSFSAAGAGTGGEWLGPHASGVVSTAVGFSDQIQVSSPSRAGEWGTVMVKLLVDGSLSATSQGVGSTGLSYAQVVFGGSSVFEQVSSQWGGEASTTGGIPQELVYGIRVSFRDDFWQPFSVTLRTAASGSATNGYLKPGAGGGEADFGHTLTWGGVVAVLDASGQAVGDWSLRSGSGFDYAQPFASPVPEPQAGVLMAAGLAALVAWARRRGQRAGCV